MKKLIERVVIDNRVRVDLTHADDVVRATVSTGSRDADSGETLWTSRDIEVRVPQGQSDVWNAVAAALARLGDD